MEKRPPSRNELRRAIMRQHLDVLRLKRTLSQKELYIEKLQKRIDRYRQKSWWHRLIHRLKFWK